jgi:hypothetical protein
MAAKRPLRKPHLSLSQLEVVGQFNDAAFENLDLTFDQVAKKVLGRPFPNTALGRKFREEAKAVLIESDRKPELLFRVSLPPDLATFFQLDNPLRVGRDGMRPTQKHQSTSFFL